MFAGVATERLTAGLTLRRDDRPGPSVVIVDAGGPAERPFLRLRPGPEGAGLVDLVLLDGERSVAVAFQPAAVEHVVRERARRSGRDGNGWAAAVAGAVGAAAATWEHWHGGGPDLTRALGGFGHPVLGAAYDAGAATVGEVPRWASPGFRRAGAAAAAADLFGSATTRPVVRALAGLLAAPEIDWWRLAVVTAAARAGTITADELATTLAAPAPVAVVAAAGGPAARGAAAAPAPAPEGGPAAAGTGVPTAEDLRRVVAGLVVVGGAGRSGRLLRTAVARPDGARRLVDVLGLLADLGDDIRRPVPSDLDELGRLCLRTAIVDPGPPPPPDPAAAARTVTARRAPARAPARPAPAPPAPVVVDEGPRRQPAQRHTTPLRAPEVRGPRPPDEVHFRHRELARELGDGLRLDATTDLALPRTPAELMTWGRLLGNCLGSYATAVAEGASIVVAVRERGLLVAAFEVRSGRLTQVLGPGNRPAPPRLARLVEAHVARVLTPARTAQRAGRLAR